MSSMCGSSSRKKEDGGETESAELMDVERGILHESKQRNELLKELNSKTDAMLTMKQEKMRILKESQLFTNDDSFVYK
ncbi:hypothetical protein MAR_020427 [Mya arenaria]|uniref:Uncharacterized protein n=1 Tax=Mya arenaria TaxID=6604 RepID=A0ABY7E4X2_MYAAR|nr:hypothetical protein MAR_020427 [Mya arenaria]